VEWKLEEVERLTHGVEGADGSQKTNKRCGIDRHETGGGRDTNKTGNDTGAETNDGELAGVEVLKESPHDATTASSQVGVDHNVDAANAQVGGGATVEREPSEPDENSAQTDEEWVVSPEVADLGVLGGTAGIQTGTEHEGPRKRGETGGNVHGAGTGEIVHTELVEPAAWVPLPVSEHVVDKGGPAEKEKHGGE